MSVTLLIVDLCQYCVCCIRSGVSRCTLFMVCCTWPVCASADYTRWCGQTSAFLCACSLYDLADPVFVGVGLAKSSAMFFYWLIPTIVFYYFSLSLPSVYRLVLLGWGLRTDREYTLSLSLAQPTFLNNETTIYYYLLSSTIYYLVECTI